MPPVTRKASALLIKSIAAKESSVKKYSDVSFRFKHKCPVNGCTQKYMKSDQLRYHHRSHTKVKPYKCTFPPCNQTHTELSDLIRHICKVHGVQTIMEAKKYVEELKEVLAEEDKQLGIKKCFIGKVYGEVYCDTNAISPKLPHFTTIHRTSTGRFICPLKECDKRPQSLAVLRYHYRIHGNSQPFRCIFPVLCRFSSNKKADIICHVRMKHLPPENADLNPADFVETRTDWLEVEDALFRNAKIISPKKIKRPRPYACTFPNCTKKFTFTRRLLEHIRVHSQSKPFSCSYPDCDHTTHVRPNILRHVLSVHFYVPNKEVKYLTQEEKTMAKQYVVVNQHELDNEKAQLGMVQKNKCNKQNLPPTNTNELAMVKFDSDITDEEDDKDQLALPKDLFYPSCA